LKKGTFDENFTMLGVDLDLERIAGIRGAVFHFYPNSTSGQNYSPYSGGLYPFNRIWSFNAASRLNELSYEQTLFDDRVNIRLGRLPASGEFDFSSVYCSFVTGFCAVPAPYAYSKAYPAYNTASWGSIVQIKLTDAYYFDAAVYENEPVLSTVGHYGWPGEDCDTDNANGAVFPMQFGYKTSYANDLYPKSWAVGWFYNTGKYNDPHFNTQGQILAFSGGTPRSDWGNSGFWLQAQQVVWRPDPRNDRGLTLFTGFNYSTSGENNIQDGVFGGASLKGLFAERPNDTINFAAMYIGMNNNFVDNQNDKLIAHGISGSMKNYEAFLELNYQLALAPGMYFQPFVDYIWNPDQVGLAIPNPNIKHDGRRGDLHVVCRCARSTQAEAVRPVGGLAGAATAAGVTTNGRPRLLAAFRAGRRLLRTFRRRGS
jgi:porin